MKISQTRLFEFIGVLAVMLSLIFVGLEFQQSTWVSQASAYQKIGIATAESIFLLATDNEHSVASLKSSITTDWVV